jgi:hypothetical protein
VRGQEPLYTAWHDRQVHRSGGLQLKKRLTSRKIEVQQVQDGGAGGGVPTWEQTHEVDSLKSIRNYIESQVRPILCFPCLSVPPVYCGSEGD